MKKFSSIATLHARPSRLIGALAVAGLVSHLLAPAHAQTLPSGMNVVGGQANVSVNGTQMTVTNSAGAALNWQSFSIGAGHGVHFQQPSAASKVLNRVVGNDPSQIFGSLSSNGQVWLLNPNGVLFGRDARVDVAGLVVSTLNMGNDDWRAGRFSLAGDGAGSIVNQGELRSSTGGRILLLAGAGGVRNEGLISAPDGQVALAAGQSIDLIDEHNPQLAVRVQAPQGAALNLGSMAVGGGRVDLAAAMVNQQGIVRAESLQGQGGQIVLNGRDGVTLAAGSVTSADGASGGRVALDGGSGAAMVAGRLSATGSAGRGGELRIEARQIGLLDGAKLDVSGSAGGGLVRAGGGLQGRDGSMRNAQALYQGPLAAIHADATAQGDGGTIILWSDEATRAYGTLTARGGFAGGNGGFIETSGGWLDARPALVRTDAPLGQAGLWLLDPNNLTITDFGNNLNMTTGPNFETTNDNAQLLTDRILSALQAGNNVVITTANGGSNTQAGDITFSGANLLGTMPSGGVSLTVNAARDIRMLDSRIIANSGGGALNVVFNAATGASGTGAIQIQRSTITTAGGNITLGGNVAAVGPNITSPRAGAVSYTGGPVHGVGIIGSTLDAGSGAIRAVGQSVSSSGSAYGVYLADDSSLGTVLNARDIELWGWVDSNADIARRGVFINGASTAVTATHSLDITGLANSTVYRTAVANAPSGVLLELGALRVLPGTIDPTASLRIQGTVNDAAPVGSGGVRTGIAIDNPQSSNRLLQVSNGTAVTLIGQDGMNSADANVSAAIGIYDSATLDFGGAGAVAIQGNSSVIVEAAFTAPSRQTVSLSAGRLLTLGGNFSGDTSALTLNAQDITLTASVQLGTSNTESSFSATATRNILLDGASITNVGLGTPISLTSAAGGSGAGAIRLFNAYLESGGADITLGGGSTATGPNITSPRPGAIGNDTVGETAGVSIIGSTVDAGSSGTLRITGQSTATTGSAYGVFIGNDGSATSTLRGYDVDIYGWVDSNAPINRAGVRLDEFGEIRAERELLLAGVANSGVFQANSTGPIGLHLMGFVTVESESPVTGSLLSLSGSTNDAAASGTAPRRAGLLVDGPNASIYVGNGVGVQISGADESGNNHDAVRLTGSVADFSSARSLSISGNGSIEIGNTLILPDGEPVNVSAGYDLRLSNALIYGAPSALSMLAGNRIQLAGEVDFGSTATNVTLRADELTFGDGAVFGLTTGGTVSLFTNTFSTDQASTISSSAAGTAIVVAGFNMASNVAAVTGSNITSFETPNGRWLFYTRGDVFPANTAYNYNFREYGLTYGGAPNSAAIGNGFIIDDIASMTLTASTPITKVYDGTTAVIGTPGFDLTGLRPGHSFTGSSQTPTVAYSDPNVSSAQTLTVSNFSQPGVVDANNRPVYGYVLVNDVQGSITPRTVTLTGVAAGNRAYDGTTVATLSGGSLGNLVAGETLGFTLGGGLFNNANVGTSKPVTGSATLQDGSGRASNYVLAGSGAVSTSANITPRPLTLSGIVAADKTYDGTTAATLSGGTLGNLVTGETLVLALGSGSFDNANAGTGRVVSGSVTLQDGSGLASNYTLVSGGSFSTGATITPRELTLAGVITGDKVYDGSNAALLSGGTLSNLVSGETLGFTLGAGSFDNANAGTGKAVSGTATLQNGSGLASNYAVGGVSSTGNITPRVLTLSGVTVADRPYDGTTAATIGGGTLGNLVAGETLGLALSGAFVDPNAGVGKAVNGNVTLQDGSGLASNYTLGSGATLSTTATITPRVLTLAGVTVADKPYDGTTAATIGGGTLGNLVAGETLGVALSGVFADPNAGVGKAVNGSVELQDGSGLASNYTLGSGSTLSSTANITPRVLTLGGVAVADKVYDGTTSATLSGGTLGNLVTGETLVLGLGSATFDNANVGNGKAVSAAITLGNGSGLAGNYTLASTTFLGTAAITPAVLQYVATPATLSFAQLVGGLGGQVTGFVNNETLAGATTGTLSFSASGVNAASAPGSYAVNGSGLSAVNYVFTQAAGNATALTLLASVAPSAGLPEVTRTVEQQRIELPPPPPNPQATQALDVTAAVRMEEGGNSVAFGALDLSALSREEVAALLEARHQYKQSLLRRASERLQADPALADAPGCASVKQAEDGRCVVGDELIARAENEPGVVIAQGLTTAPTPVTPSAPVPPVPAPVAPAATTAPAPAVAAAAPTIEARAAAPRLRPQAQPVLQAPNFPALRPVRTATLPQIQRKIAVLVGVDNYADARIPSLDNAGRDVEAVAQVLERQLGYETIVVRDAGREAILGTLNKLALQAKPNDSIVVYYAGHGTVVEETGLGYWIPANADAEKPETWVSNRDIDRLLGRIRASQVVLVSDSCFSGSLVSDQRLRAPSGGTDVQQLLQRRAAVVMSSGGNEPVSDGARNGHSPFATSLMARLQGLEAWRPGNNVFEQVRGDVTSRLPQTPQYGPARQGRHADGADYLFEQRSLGGQ